MLYSLRFVCIYGHVCFIMNLNVRAPDPRAVPSGRCLYPECMFGLIPTFWDKNAAAYVESDLTRYYNLHPAILSNTLYFVSKLQLNVV